LNGDVTESAIEDNSSTVAQLRMLGHLKEYGIVYAIAYFIAQDMGLLTTLATTAGGMC
jgi:hypothetical protein